jgi:ABC-type lipoprotein export system ATPase subunit
MNNLLEIRNLTKIYEAEQPIIALNNINLTVKKGDFIAFRGTSGSGKSTLLNLIGTLDIPTKGEIIFDGKKISAYSTKELALFRRDKIGFIFQLFYLMPALTVLENVILPLLPFKRFLDFNVEERAKSLLEQVGLQHEPTGNLDSLNGNEVLKLFTTLNREFEQTIILVTHDENIANQAHQQRFIQDGRLIPAEIG